MCGGRGGRQVRASAQTQIGGAMGGARRCLLSTTVVFHPRRGGGGGPGQRRLHQPQRRLTAHFLRFYWKHLHDSSCQGGLGLKSTGNPGLCFGRRKLPAWPAEWQGGSSDPVLLLWVDAALTVGVPRASCSHYFERPNTTPTAQWPPPPPWERVYVVLCGNARPKVDCCCCWRSLHARTHAPMGSDSGHSRLGRRRWAPILLSCPRRPAGAILPPPSMHLCSNHIMHRPPRMPSDPAPPPPPTPRTGRPHTISS